MKDIGLWGWISFILVIVGALNWGFIGLINANIVGSIFGGGSTLLSRLVYILVGVSAGYLIYLFFIKKA